jgi:hypothetical protein
MSWKGYPQFEHKPPWRPRGPGKVQRGIARAFIAHGPIVSSSQVFDWVGRQGGPRRRWRVLCRLREVAVEVGRAEHASGRPFLWRLKE